MPRQPVARYALSVTPPCSARSHGCRSLVVVNTPRRRCRGHCRCDHVAVTNIVYVAGQHATVSLLITLRYHTRAYHCFAAIAGVAGDIVGPCETIVKSINIKHWSSYVTGHFTAGLMRDTSCHRLLALRDKSERWL